MADRTRFSARLRPARSWVPIAAVVALAAATIVAVRTPQESLADSGDLQAHAIDPALSLGQPHVSYQLTGEGRAQVTYITETGELSADTVVLPWSHEMVLSSPMRPASVTATALGGGEVSCALQVDGRQRDARTSGADAGVVLCSVVAA